MTDNVNIGANEGEEFDIKQIPESVLKGIQKQAREGTIPLERYEKSVGKLKDRLIALEDKQTVAPEPVKTYTRQQLQDGVDQGVITQEVMDNQLEAQVIAKARAAATEVTAESAEQQKSQKIIDDYIDTMPDIAEDGSENRELLFTAYEDIKDVFGAPKTDADKRKLEALALKAAFGPLKNLKNRTRDISNKVRATHQEVGGDAAAAAGETAETKGIPARLVAHNKRLVETGQKTWADVRDELKYVKNPQVRERLGFNK